MKRHFASQIEKIHDLLPTELFEGSKDWREGTIVERIEWLLSMYESSKQEVNRLEDELIAVNQYWHDRT